MPERKVPGNIAFWLISYTFRLTLSRPRANLVLKGDLVRNVARERLAHRALYTIQQRPLPLLVKGVEVVAPQQVGADDMRDQDFVHALLGDAVVVLQPPKIHARRVTADDAISPGGERRLVDDTVVSLWVDVLGVTPLLGYYVVDVDVLIEISLNIHRLARAKV